MDRRRLLLGSLATAAAAGLASCGLGGSDDAPRTKGGRGVETIRYGKDESQLLELTRPEGRSRGVVVVIHGGFWSSQYDLSLGRPLAASLAKEGWTAANLEYRRVGNGGGWPTTFDDVRNGIDALADVEGLDLSTLITLGHSAGGHLGVWVVGKTKKVKITAAVSQAGVLDLQTAAQDALGGGAVLSLLGDAPIKPADPMTFVPLDVPVHCVHGTDDQVVPLAQSTAYVDKATSAGATAVLHEVPGDHFVLIDPSTPAWSETLKVLDGLER
ncbi:alpha/beta hydrolase [Aeromicrobium sp. Root495]|uniref:alpha/beta hydrolase n=1 Tax=Aeromicrobium sp. Root495 TaxID=1736550 RepID=UPI0009EA1039|nr:alpha/beta hydrolase [Aeromicrobium sp. Root495]